MPTRTINDINTKTDTQRLLSPIREYDALNDSHDYIIQNRINITIEQNILARSLQTQKDWKNLDEFAKVQNEIKEKCVIKKSNTRNKKFSTKSFKMQSHILLPSKLLEGRLEAKKIAADKGKEDSKEKPVKKQKKGHETVPFKISKDKQGKNKITMEFSTMIEKMNKEESDAEGKSLSSYDDADQAMTFKANSKVFSDRKMIRCNINSVIEMDKNLFDINFDRGECNSNGDDPHTSNEPSEFTETTK